MARLSRLSHIEPRLTAQLASFVLDLKALGSCRESYILFVNSYL
jgi:hypothetical protein